MSKTNDNVGNAYSERSAAAQPRQKAECDQLRGIPAKTSSCVEDEIEQIGNLQDSRPSIDFGERAEKEGPKCVAKNEDAVTDLADGRVCDSQTLGDLLCGRSDD
jgi:hypothetical protein